MNKYFIALICLRDFLCLLLPEDRSSVLHYFISLALGVGVSNTEQELPFLVK